MSDFVPEPPRQDLLWIGADLDGTLAKGVWTPGNPTSDIGQPILENVERLREAVRRGYKSIIHTARPGTDYENIEKWCLHHDVPFKFIITGKPLFKVYLDDRAAHPNAPDYTIPTDPEVAWAAGFFDGEGSVFVTRKRNVKRTGREGLVDVNTVGISVCQVDRRPLDRFRAVVGGPNVRGPYKPKTANSNEYYRWQAEGRPSVHRVLVILWPYLSEPKKEQARRVWAELATLQRPKSPPLPELPNWEGRK